MTSCTGPWIEETNDGSAYAADAGAATDVAAANCSNRRREVRCGWPRLTDESAEIVGSIKTAGFGSGKSEKASQWLEANSRVTAVDVEATI